MAKTWYPVIDYALCTSCGTCVEFCRHAVYDPVKAPAAVVRSPEGCVDHCHGCGNRCPAGAILYVGDDTGWRPPNAAPQPEACCQASEPDQSASGSVLVEYLFLDLDTCDRCRGTEKVLDETLRVLEPALRLAGRPVECHKVKMENARLAREYRFVSSPTIRVNGNDIFETIQETSCGCCGDISGKAVDCRAFKVEGGTAEAPTPEMLAEAILRAVFGSVPKGCDCGSYKLPENLKNFYEGKQQKSGRERGDGCC